MKKITLFTKTVFTIRITQNFYQTKTKGAVHRWLSTLCLTAALLLGTVGQVSAQQAFTETWALTANQVGVSSGAGAANVTASGQAYGSGFFISTSNPYYGATTSTAGDGLRSSPNGGGTDGTWSTYGTTTIENQYMEFEIAPASSYSATVSAISFYLGNRGTGNIRASAYYYVATSNSGLTMSNGTALGTALSCGSSSGWATQNSYTPTISIPAGQKLYVRVYPYMTSSLSTSKWFCMKNVVVSGTTVSACTPPNQTITLGASTVCSNSTGNTASVTTTASASYAWTIGGTGASITGGQGTDNITYTAGTGNVTLNCVVTASSCASAGGQNKAVTVNAIPTITGTTPKTICGSGTAALGATPSVGTIDWYDASTGGTKVGTGTSWTTPSLSATITYYAEAVNGTCISTARTAVTATVTALPTITGTTPNSITGTGTVTLGAAASAGTISWFANLTGGSVLGTGTSFTTPSISTTTTYYVETNDGTCTSSPRTAVVATVACPTYALSTTAVATSPICVGTAANVNLTGTAAALPTGTYTVTYSLSGANTATNSTAAMTVSTAGVGNFTTGTLASAGSTTITVTKLVSGSCTTSPISTSNTATVTTNALPTITGTTPGSTTGAGTVTLGAASAGTISWFANLTGGSALGTGTSFTTPSISATTTYYAETNDGTCTSSPRTAVLATVTCPTYALNTTAIATSPICAGNIATANLTGTGANLPIGTYTVTYSLSGANTATNSTATMTVTTAGAGSFTTSALAAAGSTTITVTKLVSGSCTSTISANNTATVTTNALPTITGTTPNSITGTGTVTLGATASAGTISWFANLTGGTALGTGTSFTTPSISATTTYYVETTSGTCTSSSRTAVVASVTGTLPEIDIQGGATPTSIASGKTTTSSTDWTDFGPITTSISTTRTFTILNTGGATLNITGAITFSGSNANNFSASVPSSTAIAPGASATFVVTLTPNSTGTRTAIISIPNNDTTGSENPYTFTIKGTSGNADIRIQGGGSTINDGETTTNINRGTDFGSTGVSAGTIVKTFTIDNNGSGGLVTLGAITIGGTNASDFTVTTAPGTTSLTGGASTTFSITFNPSASGLRTATFSIVNNDPDENPYNFAIQGTGGQQEIDVKGNATSIADGDMSPALTDNTDFDSVNYTLETKTITYTIENLGNEILTIGTISLSGSTDFAITQAVSSSLAPGASTTFTVTFDPSAAATRTATISIPNNDSNENPYDFSIKGTGTAAPNMSIQANSTNIADGDTTTSTGNRTNFGSINTGTPVTYTYTISNASGAGPLNLGAITMTGAAFSATAPASTTVAAGSSTTFTITFNPTVAGAISGSFSIVTNDTNASRNPYNFALAGNGVTAPEIDVKGNSVSIANGDTTPSSVDYTDFGSVAFSSGTITKTFYIHNTGASNLTISGITKGGTNPGDFTITTSPSAIAAGDNSALVITFDPSVLGTRSCTITIANNDADESSYTFDISGSGTQASYDSDGDGISDNADDDDDNDGILDITEETNCTNANGTKTNFDFLKEDFGTGVRTSMGGTNYRYEDGSNVDLDDGEYTLNSNANVASWAAAKWYQGGDHTTGTGRMAIFNAATTAGVFYTATIVGTIPGVPITYSFWGLNLDKKKADGTDTTSRGYPNIKVEFRDMNDVAIGTPLTTNNIPQSGYTTSASDWHQYGTTITLPANLPGNAFKVIFSNLGPGGAGNDLAIDDITITQSLCDYENDGVADIFDLDSDNDGIPDIVEAGLGSLSNGTGKIDVTWVDTNTNGIYDGAETTAALPTKNSDLDTLPDYLDLDSDNDSVFDIDESGAGNSTATAAVDYQNGDGDINGDGVGDGSDSEHFRPKDTDGSGTIVMIGDGILDLFDYSPQTSSITKYGNLGQANPKDSDGDGTPDYLDPFNNTTGIYDIENNKLIYNYKTLTTDADGVLTSITDADKDGIIDSFDTNTAVKGSPRDLYNNKLLLDFDGRNDYAKSTSILGGLTNATLMAWISLNPAFATEGVVVGQDKFHIRITAARTLQAVVNGTTATYGTALNVSQWYHITATYDNTNLRLYLNGQLVSTQAVAGPISADTSLLTIGRDPNSILPTGTKYFKGKIDEVRVFNIALTDIQVQRTVYQEIDPLSTKLKGTIANKEIAQDLYSSASGSLTFTNLLRYYRMDTYKDDIIDDLSTPATDVLTGAKIYNHKKIYLQQAPMPFITTNDGDLATAVTDATRDIAGADINIYNTIVNVKHDNTITSTRTDLGLVVDAGKSLTVNGDAGLTNTWWLSLNGKIDLVGKAQLVQNSTSDLDVTSAGSIERDQQGQTNKFNYNYWSSPVNPINTTANNTNYTVAEVMKDGTTSTPQPITWVGGYDGSPTSPISLARYWLYKFESATDAYANWVQFTEGAALRVGQGYTLKGSGAATATQNFTFVGKPNNGTITNTVGSGQLLLVGNPYPSAIDAYKFLDDNTSTVERSATDGTLYFWQHAPENNTHLLANYLGSYGVLNRTGGVPPIVPTLISGGGSTAKTPKQYIPVGQGFFVYGTAAGGSVQFNNSQRAFIKEDDIDGSSNPISNTLFKTKASTKTAKETNNNDVVTAEPYKKIRLGYNTANGYHRQVLLAFMDEKATSDMDFGYDGETLDDFPNDMSLLKDETQLVIEGEGYFDANTIYPIGVKSDIDGKISFIIDDIENFDAQQPIFVHDNLTDTYHDIREGKLEIDLPSTSSTSLNNRFSLRFKDKTLSVNENKINENAITVSHIQKGNILEINNQLADTTIEKVTLFNVLGQSINSWKIENPEQKNIQIPLKSVSSGVYITKIKTSKGDVSKKIIIK